MILQITWVSAGQFLRPIVRPRPSNRITAHHSVLTRSAVNRKRITSTSVRGSVSPARGETPVFQTGRELFRRHTPHLLARSGPRPPGTPLCAARQAKETLTYNIPLMPGQTL